MKIKPIGQRILVKPKENEQKTAGGIFIPDSAMEKTNQGEVVAVGELKDVQIKVGDIVMYESFGANEVKIDGKKYLILQVKDIVAKLE